MAVDTYSIRVMASLLDGTTTYLADDTSDATTGSLTEAHGGLPMKVAGLASDVNVKLGTLTDPKFLKVSGAVGITVKIAESGTALSANPWLFLSETTNGLGISEIWISNSEASEATVSILAGE
jgi:hypothetical protein